MITDLITPVRSKAQLAALKLITKLIPSPVPNMLLGAQSRLRLVEHMAHFDFKRVLIVTDDVLLQLGVTAPIDDYLNELGIETAVYSGVTPDPGFLVVENGLEILHNNDCDAVLAIGGGSSIDALTHCLESWISDFSTPETEFYSGAGVKLVFKYLEQACENGQDFTARDAMALAANYGGMALNKTGLGYVHAIAREIKGIGEKHFNVMAQAAMKEAHGTYAVPRYTNKNEIVQVLRIISGQTT